MTESDNPPPSSSPPGWPHGRPFADSGWLTVEEGRRASGVRVTDSPYWGAWWAQALRAILFVKQIPYQKIVHPPYNDQDPTAQDELVAWTAQSSVPVMAYNDGSPRGDVIRSDWLGQLMLAEQMAPEPRLLPLDPADRIQTVGLAHELMSPQGLMWNARLAMSELFRVTTMTEKQRNFFGKGEFLGGKYAHNGKPSSPLENVRQTLQLMQHHLDINQRKGSRFFVGNELTVVDLYWVYASNFVQLLSPASLPIMRFNRAMYPAINHALQGAVGPSLMEHRDYVLHEHLELPVVVD